MHIQSSNAWHSRATYFVAGGLYPLGAAEQFAQSRGNRAPQGYPFDGRNYVEVEGLARLTRSYRSTEIKLS